MRFLRTEFFVKSGEIEKNLYKYTFKICIKPAYMRFLYGIRENFRDY